MIAAETESKPTQNRNGFRSRKQLLTLCGLLLVTGVAAIAWIFRPVEAPVIPESVSRSEYDRAAEDYAKLFRRPPTEADTLHMLAESAARSDRPEVAVDCLAMIPSDHRRYGMSARLKESQLLLQLQKVDKAEKSLREFLQLANDSTYRKSDDIRLARQLLVYLLTLELRFEERKIVLQQMLEERQFDVIDAKQYYFPSLLMWKTKLGSGRLRDFLKQDPTNLQLLTAHARHLVGEGKIDGARELLETLRRDHPADRAVTAASLECCYEENNWPEFESILSTAPDFGDDEPWLLTQMRAEYSIHTQDWASAEKHFRQVLAADPSNPACYVGLSIVLSNLGRVEERTIAQDRSLTLARIRVLLPNADSRSPEAVWAVSAAARTLEMDDAAAVFALLAERMSDRVR